MAARALVIPFAVAACNGATSRGAPAGAGDGGRAEDTTAAAVGSPTDAGPSGMPASLDASTDAATTPAPDASPSASPDAAIAEPRLGWPADGDLAGIYATIDMVAGPAFHKVLAQVAGNGMNAVVVDGKDYQGWLTYPSSIPLAKELHASHKVVPSMPALVHEAHQRGLRVLMRVACFHDPWTAQRRPDLAIPGVRDWVNPDDATVQDYLLAVVDETLSAGVDEIQLDYVRYPTEGVARADFGLAGRKTTEIITGFVKRVHERTAAAGVPLALDIFGVVAWQRDVDVRATGRDLASLGAVVEAISPMVYPSHFREGFNGYAVPGAHPEVVGFGTKQAVDVLKKAGSKAIVRPWIQAFPWHAPGYDASYVIGEIAQARAAGGVGWLGWNAGGYYGELMAASWGTRMAPKVKR
jgi:hypothetical protein